MRDNAIVELKALTRSEAISGLIPLLSDPQPRQRAFAAEAMILLDARQTLEFVLPLLKDTDPDVRGTICFWLTEYGDQRAVEPLVQVLLNDPDVNVRTGAASALGASRDTRAVAALVKARDQDFEVDRQGYIVSSVAKDSLRDMGIE